MRTVVRPSGSFSDGLRGRIKVAGDKSICHRSILLGAIASGETIIKGFVPGADCLSTVRCVRALGVELEEPAPEMVRVFGRGLEGLGEPQDVLDAGNSGTTTRLLSGILAGQKGSGGSFEITRFDVHPFDGFIRAHQNLETLPFIAGRRKPNDRPAACWVLA